MEIRRIERTGFCRGCDDQLEKGSRIFYTYSDRNRGVVVILCMKCVELVGDLANKEAGDG